MLHQGFTTFQFQFWQHGVKKGGRLSDLKILIWCDFKNSETEKNTKHNLGIFEEQGEI
jgi:hypothetical protein